jgi:hypothetical protein
MIAFARTASIAPGKVSDAVAFANQMAKYIKDKYGRTLQIFMPVGGNPYRIEWRTSYQDLAELESVSAKLMADTEYLGLIAKNSATFLPGSAHDEIWKSI